MASLFLALFLSGSAALVYQSTWGRMLHRVFGVSDLAIATVLATFFLGLGLGSALGGRWGKRTQAPVRLYALLEVLIGAWALLSIVLVPRIHDVYAALGAESGFGLLTCVRFLIALLVLLPPTLLMGATLPVLVAAVARRGFDWSSSATSLYATNTIGAVVGAGITGLFLVPELGARLSIVVAAAASFSAALIVFGVWGARRNVQGDAPSAPSATEDAKDDEGADDKHTGYDPDNPGPEGPPKDPLDVTFPIDPSTLAAALPGRFANATQPEDWIPRVPLAMILASIAGFASLASEVLWTRVLRMVVQGTTQAFAAMLVNYLVGIALGALFAERLMRRPGRNALALFGYTQLVLVALTGLAMGVAAQLPRLLVLIQGSTNIVPHEAWVVLVVSAVLLFPLALVLGTSIPLAWKIAGGDADEAAQHSGRVLASNTLGGLCGSLIAGFVLVPMLGIEAAIMIVLLVHMMAATIALVSAYQHFRLPEKVLAALGPVALAIGILVAQPSLHLPYLLDAWYDGYRAVVDGPGKSWDENVKFLREGRNTTVTVLDRDGSLRLFNDGRPESGFGTGAPGFGEELVTLGTLPTVFAEKHERAMVIGLGAAHTTAVLLGGPWERLDVIELEGAVVDAARFLYKSRDTPFPLDDERTHLVVDDARAQLVLAEAGTYDAIVSQPSHPWLAGSSALYTKEFFAEAQRALTEGGVLALWSNLFRMDIKHLKSIVATLFEVFEHVHAYVAETSSFILVASNTPLALGERTAERLQMPGLQPFLDPFAMGDLVNYVGVLELDSPGARRWSEDANIIVDDRPVLEFELARIPHFDAISEDELDRSLRPVPWMTPETFEAIPADVRADVLVQRIDYVSERSIGLRRIGAFLEMDAIMALLTPVERALVRGVYAEQQGDVPAALTAYDEATGDARALERAIAIRSDERLYGQLVRQMDEIEDVLPYSATAFLRASLARDDPSAIHNALRLSERVDRATDRPLARVLRAYLDEGCEGLLQAARAPENTTALDEEQVRSTASRCAYLAGDIQAGQDHGEQALRLRRASAAAFLQSAQEADNAGNLPLAFRGYARAFRAWPGNAAAAAGYARNADRFGYPEKAAAALRQSWQHVRDLPSSGETLRTAADELGVDLYAAP